MAKLKITQIKSRIGSSALQKKNLDALGLRKINQTVEHDDSAIILGMVEKVKHLVRIEEVKFINLSRAGFRRSNGRRPLREQRQNKDESQ